jgi:probable phosphoglycerate mutase
VLILVRHGRTALNATGRLVGRLDPPLDEVGELQAAAIGDALKGADRVISSPLLRARQTADRISPDVEVDERWIEVDYGDFDGVPIASPEGTEIWTHWREDTAWQPPHGESLAQMAVRVVEACQSVIADAADQDIVVVSHVSPIKVGVAWALGASGEVAWRSHLDQASISRIAMSARGVLLRTFNETWHLADVPRGEPRIEG